MKRNETYERTGIWCAGVLLALNYFSYVYLSSLRGVEYGASLLLNIDKSLPVYTSFIPIYLFFYFYIVLMALLMELSSTTVIRRRFLVMFFLNYLIAFVIYIIFPTNQDSLLSATKEILPLDNSLYYWIITVLEPDSGAFPSIHVSVSVSIFLFFIAYYPHQKIKWIVGTLSLIWIVLMCLSAMSLKVHYFFDVLSGVILGYVCFYIGYYKDIFGFETRPFWNNNLHLTYILFICSGLLLILFCAFIPESLHISIPVKLLH